MEFVLDALLDSLKLLPFLFLAYVLIEVMEYFSARKLSHSRLLCGRFSTLFGAGFALLPQCGFSVVATDLFAEKKINVGTLLAVYIATSDEAVPIMLMHPQKIITLLPLLLIKFVAALLIGYSVDLIFKKYNQKRLASATAAAVATASAETIQTTQAPAGSAPLEKEQDHAADTRTSHSAHDHDHDEEHHIGCCGHDIEDSKGSLWKIFLLHPLIHTIKIFAFILIVNLAFGGLVALVTEERLTAFLAGAGAFAPLIAALIGLIPNCASSVVITNLYLLNAISFGACMAGLIVNAGIAFVVLFKQNKNLKENFAILGTMLAVGVIIGYIIQLIGF